MPLTWLQKDYRAEARYYGRCAVSELRAADNAYREALVWRRLVPEAQERIEFWERRGDRFAQDAEAHAVQAVRLARLSQEGRVD